MSNNTKKEMYKVWCEYDIDQDGKVFNTEEEAVVWAKETVKFLDVELEYMTYEELTKDGLIKISPTKVF